MNTQETDLAAPFLEAHYDLLTLVECCAETQWRAIPTMDRRSVGVLAYHIAQGYSVETELIKANAITIPSNGKATDAIADPTLKKVLAYLQGVTYNQLYFDQYMTAAIGNAINDAVSNFIAGQGSSADLAGTVAKAASQ